MVKRYLKNSLTKNITMSGFFVAVGLLLPQIFHGVGLGNTISPMHIPILLCAFFLDWPFALAVGFLTPLMSMLCFQMPQFPMVFIMAVELGVYAVTANLFYTRLLPRLIKKRIAPIINVYISLAAAIILGRIFGACAAVISFYAFGFAGYTAFFYYLFVELFAKGIVAIVIQLLLIPPLTEMLKKYMIAVDEPVIAQKQEEGNGNDPAITI